MVDRRPSRPRRVVEIFLSSPWRSTAAQRGSTTIRIRGPWFPAVQACCRAIPPVVEQVFPAWRHKRRRRRDVEWKVALFISLELRCLLVTRSTFRELRLTERCYQRIRSRAHDGTSWILGNRCQVARRRLIAALAELHDERAKSEKLIARSKTQRQRTARRCDRSQARRAQQGERMPLGEQNAPLKHSAGERQS